MQELIEMKDEKYYLNNKIYNISKSVKLYEYIEEEPTGRYAEEGKRKTLKMLENIKQHIEAILSYDKE